MYLGQKVEKNLHRVPKVYWEILGAFSDSTTILILWCIDFYGGISKVQSLWRNKLFCRREVPFAIFFIPDSCYHYRKGKNILSSEAEIVQQQPWIFHPYMVGDWIRMSVLMCSGCHWHCSMKAERDIIVWWLQANWKMSSRFWKETYSIMAKLFLFHIKILIFITTIFIAMADFSW